MVNSRQKGARGERELRDLFRQNGYLKARRTQQYCGYTGDASDLHIPELPELHVESKRVERGNVYDWVSQAERDAKGKLPVVGHKRNNADTLFILPSKVFFEILRRSDLPKRDPEENSGQPNPNDNCKQ